MTGRRAALVLLATCGCGGAAPVGAPKTSAKIAAPEGIRIVHDAGRPAIAIVSREGDPAPFVAAFVSTSGIADARGAVVPVALAGLFASRLPDARVTPQADGVRIAVATNDVTAIVAALVLPVTASTDLAIAKRKVAALSALPRPHVEETNVVACEGRIAPPADASMPPAEELERWRARAVVIERVAFGAVGASPKAPALPSGTFDAAAVAHAELATYDASGETPNGTSVVSIAWRGDFRALEAARALGDPNGALVAMLASSGGAHLRSANAALSADGACLSLRLRVDADAQTSAGVQRIAQAIALATSKARAATLDAHNVIASPADAPEAAEQASIVALASTRDKTTAMEPSVVIGAPNSNAQTHDALAHAIADASRAWGSPVVEARARVEHGQSASWMLVASPCGTAGEAEADAGASAAFAFAVATAARTRGIAAEPWIASDGVGVVASGADASALADVLARTVLVDPIDGARAAQGRLLDGAHAGLSALAQAIAPGRPASIVPTGTPYALLRLSEPAIAARAESLRRGPLRVSMLANADAAQSEAAIARVDRWVLRDGARACPAQSAVTTPKPGTYAVATDDGTSEAYLALAVPADSETEARAIAGVLEGEDGLLAKALGDGVARESSARVLGSAGARTLVVHVDAPSTALDAAVAQARALLDRVRQGAIAEADLARYTKRSADARTARMRDPRERVVALFRGEPAKDDTTLERVRAAAAAFVRDDALVIVAARPRTRKTP